MPKKFLFKIVVGGDGGVGKTTLLHRYISGKFHFDTLMTLGVEFHHKILKLSEDIECRLILWDLSGQEHFRFFLDKFIDGAHGAILMFDLTRFITLVNLEEWAKMIRKFNPEIPILLVGSKSDLVKDILHNEDKALDFKTKLNFPHYLKVSSLTGENVEDAFTTLTKEILIKHKKINLFE